MSVSFIASTLPPQEREQDKKEVFKGNILKDISSIAVIAAIANGFTTGFIV